MQLQTLPVWIVKNIFNYLDVKTLKNVKVVNSYWAFIIDQLTLDRKARKTIDKHIKQSEVYKRQCLPINNLKHVLPVGNVKRIGSKLSKALELRRETGNDEKRFIIKKR